jgi:hypothetical protein
MGRDKCINVIINQKVEERIGVIGLSDGTVKK